jgi:hypothetical protein
MQAVNSLPLRLQRLPVVVQRVLNVNGYAELTHHGTSDTVGLSQKLFCRRFDLVERPIMVVSPYRTRIALLG